MHIDFTNKVAIITGAAHGFGRAIALAFANRGATVWSCDIQAEGLAETERQARTLGANCNGRQVDVSEQQQVQAFVQDVIKAEGRIDILVNNAGGVLGHVGKPLEQVSLQEWQSILNVNLNGTFFFAQAVAPTMKAQRSGRIINISSGAGLRVSLTGIQAYTSAKAAQIGLTKQLAHELGTWGITVNNVAPGFVRSNPTTEKQWQSYGSEGQERLVDSIALKRLGSPDDIAHAVLFFASEQAGWITGTVLPVDGGRL